MRLSKETADYVLGNSMVWIAFHNERKYIIMKIGDDIDFVEPKEFNEHYKEMFKTQTLSRESFGFKVTMHDINESILKLYHGLKNDYFKAMEDFLGVKEKFSVYLEVENFVDTELNNRGEINKIGLAYNLLPFIYGSFGSRKVIKDLEGVYNLEGRIKNAKAHDTN